MLGKKIIIVEDEHKIAQIISDYLRQENFDTFILNDGTFAVEKIEEYAPDFIILDLMLPGKDGLTICKEVRRFSEVPIMMITAKVDEVDRLIGLEIGADDYICKPFSPREVVARVKTIFRRIQQVSEPKVDILLSYKHISLNMDRYDCTIHHQSVELTQVELKLLHALIVHPGRVLSRDLLMRKCYDDNRVVSDRTIDSHVRNLRKKLSVSDQSHDLIHSIYGVGYKLE